METLDMGKIIRRYICIHPYPAKLIYLNFHPLEVASRFRDPQPQVVENYSYLFNLTFTDLDIQTVINFIPDNSGFIG